MKDAMKAWLNRWRRRLWQALFYRMVFGERTAQGAPLPHTRIAPSTCIEGEEGLQLADHVFIGHFNFLDAAGGLRGSFFISISPDAFSVNKSRAGTGKRKKRWKISIALLAPLA